LRQLAGGEASFGGLERRPAAALHIGDLVHRVKLIECARDAWQDRESIPTEVKLEYLRRVRAAGIKRLDAVGFYHSFTDAEALAQGLRGMKDTEIIALATNDAGVERALANPSISTVAYPYSVSAHYRRANANLSRAESRDLAVRMRQSAQAAGRGFVVYVAMAFGNPWNEPWGPELLVETLEWLTDAGVTAASLADTAGAAGAEVIAQVYSEVKDAAPAVELGVHLHSRPEDAADKVLAAYAAGCRRFDCALTGLGECYFAGDARIGNLPTETVVAALGGQGVPLDIDPGGLAEALAWAGEIRSKYRENLAHDH
jgi:hydroxymethylglutaryl-CoA lyase